MDANEAKRLTKAAINSKNVCYRHKLENEITEAANQGFSSIPILHIKDEDIKYFESLGYTVTPPKILVLKGSLAEGFQLGFFHDPNESDTIAGAISWE